MAEILGLGVTHWPVLVAKDECLTRTFKATLAAPNVPARYKDRANWPAQLLTELGDDDGLTAASAYSSRLAQSFRTIRKLLDDFEPDVVVIWGDDQYENFKEDIVPPFCVLAFDDMDLRPWATGSFGPNRWNEPADWAFGFRGQREAAKYLTGGLLERGIDMSYAYRPLHTDGLSHAFLSTLLFLDWDRQGFPYPVIPFSVNCYGSSLFDTKGGLTALFRPTVASERFPDPPAPAPRRCMQVGAAVADAFRASPWRVALIASSSWSHAFLSPKNGYLWSDMESDRLLFDALVRGDYAVWREQSLAQMMAAGQHEMLNWMLLAGAMEALGHRPIVHDYVESFLFTSQKVFMSFESPAAA